MSPENLAFFFFEDGQRIVGDPFFCSHSILPLLSPFSLIIHEIGRARPGPSHSLIVPARRAREAQEARPAATARPLIRTNEPQLTARGERERENGRERGRRAVERGSIRALLHSR